jgi:hypothetical protein
VGVGLRLISSITGIKILMAGVGSLEQHVVKLVIMKHLDAQPRLVEYPFHKLKAAREVFLGDMLQKNASVAGAASEEGTREF